MTLTIDPWSFPDPVAVPGTADAGSSIVLAGGCFWCTEAVYSQLDGVLSVRPGYAGGSAATANYDDVCTGGTGHAEAIEVVFDPTRIQLGQVLKIFFSIAHDPTQLNRQGADVGTQYRSAIFYANEAQRLIAERYITQIISGSVGVNEAIVQAGQHDLPFGGVGASGMGHYHGYEGFLTFSKLRPVFRQARISSIQAALQPPYGKLAKFALDWMFKLRG